MAKNQKSYTPEFKKQIVDLHCKAGKGVTEISNEYGIPKGTVSTWIKNLAPVITYRGRNYFFKGIQGSSKKIKDLEIENKILKKLQERGKQLIKIDKYYPSSQICSCYGYTNPLLKDDSIRKWVCRSCGSVHNRDTNSAINIKNEVIRILGIA